MNTENQSEISIGVDVDKANLDIAIYPLERHFRIPNTREAIQKNFTVTKRTCYAVVCMYFFINSSTGMGNI